MNSFNPRNHPETSDVNAPNLQMKKLRPREIQEFAQDHTALDHYGCGVYPPGSLKVLSVSMPCVGCGNCCWDGAPWYLRPQPLQGSHAAIDPGLTASPALTSPDPSHSDWWLFFGLREFCPLFFQLLLQIYIIISSTNARNRQASGHFYFWPHCTKLPHGRETHKDSATVINLGTKTFKKEKTPTLTFREIILSHKEGSVWHL